MRSLLTFAILLALALSGCNKRSEKFCMMNPLDDRCDPPDSGDQIPCDDQNPCDDGVCLNNVCVDCTAEDDAACMGDTPVCDTTANECVACTRHDDCDSEACLPSGACGTDDNVAYVDPMTGSANGMCKLAMPCLTIRDAVDRGRTYVKVVGTVTETVDLSNEMVTVLAEPGAILQPETGDDALTVRGTSDVTVYDLTISGGSQGGKGVVASNMSKLALHRVTVDSNNGGGVFVSGPAAVTISRSTISRNLGGGISATGTSVQYDITNSFIFRNGDPTSTPFGGVDLGVGVAPRFEFNTVADNQAAGGNPAGLKCLGTTLNAANNIIARNTPPQHTMAQCGVLTSAVQDTVTGLEFASPDNQPLSYKIEAGSSAIDQATTASDIAIDFEGQPRPAGATDQGADEYAP